MRCSRLTLLAWTLLVPACASSARGHGARSDLEASTAPSSNADAPRMQPRSCGGISKRHACVTMSPHLDRMALRPDNKFHHVETWATHRDAWIRIGAQWFLWRVDQVRNQRRLVDGRALP